MPGGRSCNGSAPGKMRWGRTSGRTCPRWWPGCALLTPRNRCDGWRNALPLSLPEGWPRKGPDCCRMIWTFGRRSNAVSPTGWRPEAEPGQPKTRSYWRKCACSLSGTGQAAFRTWTPNRAHASTVWASGRRGRTAGRNTLSCRKASGPKWSRAIRHVGRPPCCVMPDGCAGMAEKMPPSALSLKWVNGVSTLSPCQKTKRGGTDSRQFERFRCVRHVIYVRTLQPQGFAGLRKRKRSA